MKITFLFSKNESIPKFSPVYFLPKQIKKLLKSILSYFFPFILINEKICIFAHFNKNNNLENYVINYLNTLRNLVDEIIFVSTTDIKTDKMNILDSLVNKIIIKENRGYDFGSWREGLLFKNNYQTIPEEIICVMTVVTYLEKN